MLKISKRKIIISLLILIVGLSACKGKDDVSDEPLPTYNTANSTENHLPADNSASSLPTNEPANDLPTDDSESSLSANHDENNSSNTTDSAVLDTDSSESNISNLMDQIKSGDFSSLTGADETDLSNLQFAFDDSQFYNNLHNNLEDDMEWVEYDINKDGASELIYQQKYSQYENGLMKRIVAVFAFQDQETKLVIMDIVDMPRFHFLSQNGNIIYYYMAHGTTTYDAYTYYTFDDEWNKEFVYQLDIHNIYDMAELPSDWSETHPDENAVGVYYKKLTLQNDVYQEEPLSKEWFLELFEEMTGSSIYDMPPEGFEG